MKKFIVSLISSLVLAGTLITGIFAWMIDSDNIDVDINASSTDAYYAKGTGTEENPFVITKPRHLYNLAWLQYLGTYNETVYYFSLENDIDMSALKSAIPPIGTDDYPFIGTFLGNGYTIKNITIALEFGTSENLLVKKPAVVADTMVDFGSSYGLFGVVGRKEIDSNEVIGKISDFYLNNININITNKTNLLVGLISGNVIGGISNVGVGFSQILLPKGASNLTKEDFISKYTLIGNYDSSKVKWDDIPGGDGAGYGSSFDVERFYTRLQMINDNNGASSLLPSIDTSNRLLTLSSGSYAPLMVSAQSNYEGSNAEEIPSSENIGYILGNQNKFNNNNISFTDLTEKTENSKIIYSWKSGSTPRVLFKRTGQNETTTSENIVALTDSEMSSLPDGIKNLIPSENTSVTHYMIRLQQKFEGTDGSDASKQSPKSNISYYDETYSSVYLPNNGIWFKPKATGKLRFVIYTGSDGSNFSLYRLTRSNGNFANRISSVSDQTNTMYTKSLPLNALLYFEHEITESDLANNYEYLLGNDTGKNGAYFLYLDIGTNGGTQDDTTSNIEKIGFVYYDSSNTTYSEIDSSVSFSISGTTNLDAILAFKKNALLIVEYYTNDSSLIIKASGTGKSSKKDNALTS